MNAITERWIGSVRPEVLDRIPMMSARYLRKVLAEYESHFNGHPQASPPFTVSWASSQGFPRAAAVALQTLRPEWRNVTERTLDRSEDVADRGGSGSVRGKGIWFPPRSPWTSPPDQPRYARPALLLVAALAAVLFAWGIDRTGYHSFYANAVRSMSGSWRAFLFGSFDPANSITLDKLPGFLWPQALSARIFGFHAWALELPQVIEGVLSVLVLYRVVRIWAGVPAALFSVVAFTLTPVTSGVFRTPAEDAALTLLLLLAAEAGQRAAHTGRLRTLIMSGVWVGLAFQAKMLEAWAVLPALAVAYLVAAPVSRRRRFARLLAAGMVMTAVSASWIAVATVTPANDRPYIDGTTDNSAFSMVVGYNFLNRFGSVGLTADGTGSVTSTQGNGPGHWSGGGGHAGRGSGPARAGTRAMGVGVRPAARAFGGGEGWDKMIKPTIASQTGWLYPFAAIALVLGLAWRRREPRTDRLRAGYLLWGLWLVTFFVIFSAGSVGGHMYYMGVVDVALAALTGTALVAFWTAFRAGGRRSAVLPLTVVVTVAWAIYLAKGASAFEPWLVAAMIGLSAIGLVLLAALRRTRVGPHLTAAALASTGAAILVAPGAWASTVFTGQSSGPGMGAIGPAQPPMGGNTPPWFAGGGRPNHRGSHGGFGFGNASGTLTARQQALLTYLRTHQDGAKYLVATVNWQAASPFILGAGAPVLPMGGFTGQVPFPTPAHFRQLIDRADLHYVILGGQGRGMRDRRESAQVAAITLYVSRTCTIVPASAYAGSTPADTARTFGEGPAAAQPLYHCG